MPCGRIWTLCSKLSFLQVTQVTIGCLQELPIYQFFQQIERSSCSLSLKDQFLEDLTDHIGPSFHLSHSHISKIFLQSLIEQNAQILWSLSQRDNDPWKQKFFYGSRMMYLHLLLKRFQVHRALEKAYIQLHKQHFGKILQETFHGFQDSRLPSLQTFGGQRILRALLRISWVKWLDLMQQRLILYPQRTAFYQKSRRRTLHSCPSYEQWKPISFAESS